MDEGGREGGGQQSTASDSQHSYLSNDEKMAKKAEEYHRRREEREAQEAMEQAGRPPPATPPVAPPLELVEPRGRNRRRTDGEAVSSAEGETQLEQTGGQTKVQLEELKFAQAQAHVVQTQQAEAMDSLRRENEDLRAAMVEQMERIEKEQQAQRQAEHWRQEQQEAQASQASGPSQQPGCYLWTLGWCTSSALRAPPGSLLPPTNARVQQCTRSCYPTLRAHTQFLD